MSAGEIAEMVRLPKEELQAFAQWVQNTLQASKVEMHPSGDYLYVTLPEEHADTLANEHERILPAHLKGLVEMGIKLTPPSAFKRAVRDSQCTGSMSMKMKVLSQLVKPADQSADPNTQKDSYGVPRTLLATNTTNSQMVWGPCTYGYLESDLEEFYQSFNVPAKVSNVKREGFKGLPGGDNFGEASLDIQYITGIGTGVPSIVSNTNDSYSAEEGNGFGEAFLLFTVELASRSKVPNVLSLSLGSLAWDSIQLMCNLFVTNSQGQYAFSDCINYLQSQRQVDMYLSANQLQRIDTQIMKLGLRGVTVLAAAGDGGSHFSFQPFPDDEIGSILNNISCIYQFPTYPSCSPYLLSVGGTQWSSGIETPVHWSAGGGGFSWQFTMPSYQQQAVQAYLQNNAANLPPSFTYNAQNRGYPDIAAVANNVPIVMQGQTLATGGTSASTPEVAGIISLINDHRFNNGLGPLGFVNTRLYNVAAQHPGEALYDITQGNTNCGADGTCCANGFPASSGWDPATGLGSPLFPGLIKYLGVAP